MPRKTIGNLSKRPLQPTCLRAWREHLGLNQYDAAARIGVDRATLSKIERALVPYNQAFLESASEVYGCSVTDLLQRDPAQSLSLAMSIETLSDKHKEEVKSVVRALITIETAANK